MRRYPTETVDCPTCDGIGENIYAPDDPMDFSRRCTMCFGAGTIEVCANCLDYDEDCSVCGYRATLPCGHYESDLTSDSTSDFCAVCAVSSADSGAAG